MFLVGNYYYEARYINEGKRRHVQAYENAVITSGNAESIAQSAKLLLNSNWKKYLDPGEVSLVTERMKEASEKHNIDLASSAANSIILAQVSPISAKGILAEVETLWKGPLISYISKEQKQLILDKKKSTDSMISLVNMIRKTQLEVLENARSAVNDAQDREYKVRIASGVKRDTLPEPTAWISPQRKITFLTELIGSQIAKVECTFPPGKTQALANIYPAGDEPYQGEKLYCQLPIYHQDEASWAASWLDIKTLTPKPVTDGPGYTHYTSGLYLDNTPNFGNGDFYGADLRISFGPFIQPSDKELAARRRINSECPSLLSSLEGLNKKLNSPVTTYQELLTVNKSLKGYLFDNTSKSSTSEVFTCTSYTGSRLQDLI